MKFFTGYFAKHQDVSKAVSIARRDPFGISLPRIPDLAPSVPLLSAYKRGVVSEEGYTKRYLEQLNDLGSFLVRTLLSGWDECTFLCWEGSDKFCHRHILAKWLVEQGIAETVEERD